MPAAAASAEPSTNVTAITRSTGMPISAAAGASTETARIARPKRVRITITSQPDHQHQRRAEHDQLDVRHRDRADAEHLARRDERGKNFGSAPNTSWPPFWSRSETPIAVISAASRGALRSGR